MKKQIIIFMIFSLFLIHLCQAISLGTILKNDYAETKQGETAEFTILFWNTGDSSYKIVLRPEQLPEGWSIISKPEEFILYPTKPQSPPYDDDEYISLPTGVVKVFPVKVLVKTSGSSEPSEYTAGVIATAGNMGIDISIFQERVFKLKVNVIKNPTFFERIAEPLRLIGKKTIEQGNDMGSRITGAFSNVPEYSKITFLIGLLIILVGIWFIYKNKRKRNMSLRTLLFK